MAVGLTLLVLVGTALLRPNLDEGTRAKFEQASAAGSLRTIYSANVNYETTYPNLGYARELINLGGSIPCTASPKTACLMDPVLSSGRKAGYTFAYQAGAPGKDGVIQKYRVWADPPAASSSRWFFTDETGTVRF